MLDRAQRLEIIPVVEHCNSVFSRATPEDINCSYTAISIELYQQYEFKNSNLENSNTIYQVPYLFELDGSPWVDANLFLFNASKDSILSQSPNDKARRMAWILLDYKIFCESQSLELFDFSALRPVNRPTYRYFKSLLDSDDLGGRTLNQKTKVVYDFYKYIHSKSKYDFIMERVDVTKSINILINGKNGFIHKEVFKRSQTIPTPAAGPVPIGFVRDEGESLRPLVGNEYNALIRIIEGKELQPDQRLMVLIALFTGERKQTILTLRLHHLDQFNESNLGKDGLYRLKLGTENGADTKFRKSHLLHVPVFLADMLVRYSRSIAYLGRVAKFEENHGRIFSRDEMYLFLTREGNCHYMAKNDPRYLKVRTRPTGGNTKTITDKIITVSDGAIPEDFNFHWLRATFARQYFEKLRPLVASGRMKNGEDIHLIQKRLHHSYRETTEDYLKLFTTVDERLVAQEVYEYTLFGSKSCELTLRFSRAIDG